MFIGHLALGFAAKRAAPGVSLGRLLAAPILLDLIWPVFLLLGVEGVKVDPGNTKFTPLDFYNYPWTHSLVMALVWSALFAADLWFRKQHRAALVVAALVFSHWVLDFITHRPDLPLSPHRDTYFGLGLWNSIAGTLVVELSLFIAGIYIYTRTTEPRDRTGTWSFWSLIAFLVLVYVANLLGPPPPSPTAIAVSALALYLFIPWGGWIERHRRAQAS
jgi:membrane-bound metal-dependent hydrolase YbcI (DUF457 family)